MYRSSTIWNEEYESFLKENYATNTNRKLAEYLGISVSSVKNKAREMGLKKSRARRKITPSLEALVLRMSAKNSYRSVADKLDLSLSSVNNIVNEAVEKGYEKRSVWKGHSTLTPLGKQDLLLLVTILLPLVKSWCRGQFYFTLLETLAFLSP